MPHRPWIFIPRSCRFLAATVFLLVLLPGCDNDQADPVKRISYDQIQQERRDAIHQNLQPMIDATVAAFFDPESIRIVDERYYSDKSFGDSICMRINAKNKLGAYVGAKWYFFSPRNHSVTTGESANMLCSKAAR